jgi:hypothetical protein
LLGGAAAAGPLLRTVPGAGVPITGAAGAGGWLAARGAMRSGAIGDRWPGGMLAGPCALTGPLVGPAAGGRLCTRPPGGTLTGPTGPGGSTSVGIDAGRCADTGGTTSGDFATPGGMLDGPCASGDWATPGGMLTGPDASSRAPHPPQKREPGALSVPQVPHRSTTPTYRNITGGARFPAPRPRDSVCYHHRVRRRRRAGARTLARP